MEVKPRQVEHFEDEHGKAPFEDWMEGFEGQKIHGIIVNRVERVKQGNFGDWDSVGDGVFELIIDFGPGYRVYYGIDQNKVILLSGGIKKTQTKDIKTAIAQWGYYNA